ncbi:hypothetical protein [Thalassobius sp. I31.1]|uniref:hypothetical protein n=1 Tax=Thalassobius sp. I31.1 TaxID=2109912 RepID=UPI000D19DAB2|nr:hypothetical protein [Thalassobius sp. I31.1]
MTAKYKFTAIDAFEFNIKELPAIVEDKVRFREWKKEFWESVEQRHQGLSAANGVYCFVIKHGGNWKPWYVGKTASRGGFKTECLKDHKIGLYAKVAAKSGKAHMVFFPLMKPGGGFSGNMTGAKAAIDKLEDQLIGRAVSQNSELLNTQGATLYKNMYVPGLMGTQLRGKRSGVARLAREIFGE